MKTYREELNINQWTSRSDRGSGAGLDTPSGSHHPAPHARLSFGTRKERGRGDVQGTRGDEDCQDGLNAI